MSNKTRPNIKTITTRDIEKFSTLDKSKYTVPKKPKKVTRSPFDIGVSHIHTTFG